MQAICARYMAHIALPEGARVLEVGCGNGAATKLIMLIGRGVDAPQLRETCCWQLGLLLDQQLPHAYGHQTRHETRNGAKSHCASIYLYLRINRRKHHAVDDRHND
jgi:hypothetical protein